MVCWLQHESITAGECDGIDSFLSALVCEEPFKVLLSSQDNEVEQEDLAQSLSLVKDVIGAVDSKVASYEKKVRLGEIYTKTDSKSIMRMKSGQMFAKEDLKRKKLVRDGSVFLKSATGRLKGKTASVPVCLGRTEEFRCFCTSPPGVFLESYTQTSPGQQPFSNMSEKTHLEWLTKPYEMWQ